MILTGHQPNYLPYPGFFDKILRADVFLLVDTVQFVKRGAFGWIHRNRIRAETPEGWSWLTVPVLTHGRYHQSIHDARIDNRLPWRRKHWRTLVERYRHAPGFADFAPALEDIYRREWDSLSQLNETLIREILGMLEISTEVKRLSDLPVEGRAGELIINFCRELGAEEYLSGVHGRDYLDPEEFERAGIRLSFQEFRCPRYPQTGGGTGPDGFVPNLSVVDLLLSSGSRAGEILRAGSAEPAPAGSASGAPC